MKKVILLFIGASSILLAKAPIHLGNFHGSSKTYFPDYKVQKILHVQTTGMSGKYKDLGIVTRNFLQDTLQGFLNQSQKLCSKYDMSAVDNLTIKFSSLDDHHNTLIHVSANMVCLNK